MGSGSLSSAPYEEDEDLPVLVVLPLYENECCKLFKPIINVLPFVVVAVLVVVVVVTVDMAAAAAAAAAASEAFVGICDGLGRLCCGDC